MQVFVVSIVINIFIVSIIYIHLCTVVLQIIMIISRKLGFRWFASKTEMKSSKILMSEILQNYKKNYDPNIGAEKIDLSQLNIEHSQDTEEITKIVPQLEHGLDQYLNGQLVFGDKGVGTLPQQSETTSNQIIQTLSGYVQPSKDAKLLNQTIKGNCRYLSSTSSISTPLIVLYYLFGCFRTPQFENIFSGYLRKPNGWMSSFRKPVTFFLRPLPNQVYGITADHGVMPMANQVLMNLGHIIEYFLTHKKEDTAKLLSGEYAHDAKNYYRYAKVNNDLMLRSQIDCLGFDQNKKPYVFEIKSRACAPIRYDIENYKLYKDYDINMKRGLYESFEREYFDLIRGGFLKYVMQVKIGRMDGAFIAYHNTEKIYGYEYVKLKEMAMRVFGDEYNLDVSFLSISKMLTLVLDDIRDQLSEFKQDEMKIGFYADDRRRKLVVMVEPMTITKQYIPLKNRDQIKDVDEYFTKYHPLKNPFYKIEYSFYWFVNGIHIKTPELLLTPYDSLELRFKAQKKKQIPETQYIYFLMQAYKEKQHFAESLYYGHWDKTSQSQ